MLLPQGSTTLWLRRRNRTLWDKLQWLRHVVPYGFCPRCPAGPAEAFRWDGASAHGWSPPVIGGMARVIRLYADTSASTVRYPSMLEKPNLPDELITACLRTEYGVNVTRLTFLPLGADLNAAVFHAIADGETAYFLKLRSGPFADVSVALPEFLSDHHIKQIIAPLTTRTALGKPGYLQGDPLPFHRRSKWVRGCHVGTALLRIRLSTQEDPRH